ncbi:MAG: tetratricopeptide repeat protein [Pirellulales bacterium]
MPQHSNESNSIVQPNLVFQQVLDLYEAGRYLDAYHAGTVLGDIRTWPGHEGQILAGRLANNLGAPRLGRAMHWKAFCKWPTEPYCLYYGAMAYWTRFGTYHTWAKFQDVQMPESADNRVKADWAASKALMLSMMRDFMRAEQFMCDALDLDPKSPWLLVEQGELLERQDRHDESLTVLREALKIQPWFRPAVQSYGSKLIQANRDSEALEFLSQSTNHLQSGEVWCQLSVFQQELKDFDAAWQSIQQAERFWPLASADSVHKQWLAGQMSDLAYYRGDYQHALDLAKQIDRPFYKRLVERLERAIAEPLQVAVPRIQLPVPFIRQHHDTCAPATLTALAKYWKHEVEHEEIVQRICYEGTAASDERRWAEENGFVAREFRITEQSAEQLIRAGIPFTLNTVEPGTAHLQSIVGIDVYRGVFLIQDPSERHVSEAACDKLLEHYVSSGPRGMAMVPRAEEAKLESIELPDADLYDLHYEVDRSLAEHSREDARRAIVQMQKLDPEHRLTLQSQMALSRYDSNTPEHLRLSEKLLEQFPKDANLQLLRISCLTELGTRDQRLEALRAACDREDSHPLFWTRLAVELADDARQHPEAIWRLRRALRGYQVDGRALSLWGNLLWDQNQRERALDSYRLAASVSEKDENHSRTYFSAARYLAKIDQAMNWLNDRLRRFGDRSTLPARTLAGALEQVEKVPEAIQVLEESSQKHQDDGEMHCYLAMTLSRYNMREAAEKQLQLAKAKCPELMYKRTSAAMALYQGRSADARGLYLEILQQDPLDVNTLEQIAGLDRDLDGDEAAEKRLRDAVAKFPHSYSLQVSLIQWLRSFRLQAAKPEIERFLKLYSESAWGHREAAIIAISMHDLELAEQHCLSAKTLSPTNDTAYFLLGRIAQDRGDLTNAREYFREALKMNCDNDGAISALLTTCDRPLDRKEQLDFVVEQLRVQTTFGEGILAYREAAIGRIEPDAILHGLEEARASRPDLWQSWSTVVQQLMAMNQRKRAVEVATEATQRFPLTPRMWVDLALVHRAMENDEAELAALERARSINPNWVEVARELSDHHLKKKQYDKAEEAIRGVLAVDPRDPVALASLADCFYQSGKKNEALEPISRACVQAPGYSWAWQMLVDWSRELDNAVTAKETAKKVIEARPHDSRGYLHYAEACNEIEEIPEGLQMLDRALLLEPRDVDSHNLRAFFFGRLHQWDEALEACQPPVFGGQLPVTLQMRRAYVLYRKGQLREAADAMRASLKEDPDHYNGWSQLADWAEELGNLELYKEASENLLRIDPHRPVPYGYLADALLRETDSSKVAEARKLAKQHLKRAIELSPDYSYATQRLIDLELEDVNCDGAAEALELGGKYLPEGFKECFDLRILARRSEQDETLRDKVVDQLVQWCKASSEATTAMVQAVDSFDEKAASRAIGRLIDEINRDQAHNALGGPLGRLIARTVYDSDVNARLNSLADGAAFHQAVQYYVRSLVRFGKTPETLDRLLSKFRKRIRESDQSWAAVATSMLDLGKNSEVIQWTKDWKQRGELTAGTYITILAANFEKFRVKQAREVLADAVKKLSPDKPDQHLDLVRVWAGLDAFVRGDVQTALDIAREIAPGNMANWYQLGYRMLVSALELSPQLAESRELAAQGIDQILPGKFYLDSGFQNDQLSKWFLLQLHASLAKMYGKSFKSMSSRFKAWQMRFA